MSVTVFYEWINWWNDDANADVDNDSESYWCIAGTFEKIYTIGIKTQFIDLSNQIRKDIS